ncbi:xanthine/uracil permease [Gracilibacillus halotolerans]|uniref:Xanthine/uracil permease n=1 Tax=Gracilibacillus halotolerans TaxID=74386 RepID=A0A841RJC8_9BACI|nr:purine/pyrimidine permease [Gracilibacillus halotolerans]MBB6512791.1 xanthine/uracil permease [Gracilibacillus halotolerans]
MLRTNSVMETIQWFVFLLASTVAIPIIIASLYELNFVELSGLMQRTFFIVGLTSLLQGLIGHRLPIMEGPAGIWISIFSVMAVTGVQGGNTYTDSLRLLEAIMILTGIFLFLFGLFRLAQKLLFIFTPLVTGTFFLLLTVQLSGTFLQGMLGLQGSGSTIQLKQAGLAFLTFFIVLGLSTFGKGWLKNYSILIGIIIGWIAYTLFIGGQDRGEFSLFALPEIFAFGTPTFDWSAVVIAFITAIILISNLVASIIAIDQTLGNDTKDYSKQVSKGTMVAGINHGLAGLFAAVANVSLSTSAGFIGLTGQKRKAPFLYAALLLMVVSLFPPLVSFISSIPSPIANAALMASFIQLVGLALKNVTMEKLDQRKIIIVGIAYLIGMGSLFLPAEVFAGLPSIVQNVLGNGLLVGTGLVIILEQLWKE